jgi:hypothetical protein
MDESFWQHVAMSRRQSPEQRFLGTLGMINLVHSLNTAGIRHQFPDADEDEVRAILLKRRLLLRTLDRIR